MSPRASRPGVMAGKVPAAESMAVRLPRTTVLALEEWARTAGVSRAEAFARAVALLEGHARGTSRSASSPPR